MKRALLIIPLLAVILALPFAKAATTPSFDHPTSLPDQASDRAREALDARGTHGESDATSHANEHASDNPSGDEHGSDSAAIVSNDHSIDAGKLATVEHHLTNGVVTLDITITVTPGEGVNRDMNLSVDASGNDMSLPMGPPSDVPRGHNSA